MTQSDTSERAEFCQSCGALAPTRYVQFNQNIGAVILRFHKSIRGRFCRSCIDQYFWEYTLVTLLLGWGSPISLVVAPFHLVNNILRYLGTLRMGRVPDPMYSQLTWLKGMPLNLRPDNSRAMELENFRRENNILNGRFLGLVMQSPGITKTLIEQRFAEISRAQPGVSKASVFEAVIQDQYVNTSVSDGMTPKEAAFLVQEPWVQAKIKSAAERIGTLDDLTRYIVEEYQDFWNRTPDAHGLHTQIAAILGYSRQYPAPLVSDTTSS